MFGNIFSFFSLSLSENVKSSSVLYFSSSSSPSIADSGLICFEPDVISPSVKRSDKERFPPTDSDADKNDSLSATGSSCTGGLGAALLLTSS